MQTAIRPFSERARMSYRDYLFQHQEQLEGKSADMIIGGSGKKRSGNPHGNSGPRKTIREKAITFMRYRTSVKKRHSILQCFICSELITIGEEYKNGGSPARKAHAQCIEKAINT